MRGKNIYFILGAILIVSLFAISLSSAQLLSISAGAEQGLFSNGLNLVSKFPLLVFSEAKIISPGYFNSMQFFGWDGNDQPNPDTAHYGGGSSLVSYNTVEDASSQVNQNPIPLCSGDVYCGGEPVNAGCLVTNTYNNEQYPSSTSCSNLPRLQDGSCTDDAINIGCSTVYNEDYSYCEDDCPIPGSCSCGLEYDCNGTATCLPSQCDGTSSNPSQYCQYNQSISCNSITSPDECTNLGCTLSDSPNNGATFFTCNNSFCTGSPVNHCMVTDPNSGSQNISGNCLYLPNNADGSCTTDAINIGCSTVNNSALDACYTSCKGEQDEQDCNAQCDEEITKYLCNGTATCSPSQCDGTSSNPSQYCSPDNSISCSSLPLNPACMVTNPNTGINDIFQNCSDLPSNADGSCTTDATNIGCSTVDDSGYAQCVDDCDQQGSGCYYDENSCGIYPAYDCTGTATCSTSQCDGTSSNPSQYCSYSVSCSSAGCTVDSCSSITDENTCISTPGCVNTCRGSPTTCSSGETRTFTCGGTYQTVGYNDGGTCLGMTNGGAECGSLYFSQTSCLNAASNGDDCFWFSFSSNPIPYNVSVSCSGLSESDCYKISSCTPSVSCEPSACFDSDNGLNYTTSGYVNVTDSPIYYDSCMNSSGVNDGFTLLENFCSENARGGQYINCTQQFGQGYTCSNGACVNSSTSPGDGSDCSVCNSNSDCNSGICASQLGSQDKVCISSGCAITPPTGSQICQESDGTTECSTSSDSTVTCNGTTHTWEINTTCASGESCDATSTPKECKTTSPVLLWLGTDGYSLNPKNTISGNPGDLSTAVQLFVQYAQDQTGTFYLNESGLTANHSIKTIIDPVYNSGVFNSLSYNWSITNDSLTPVGNDHLTDPNQYNFYFTYNGYKSPILNYSYHLGYCGDGTCNPPTENYTSCEDDCLRLQWRNGTSPYTSVSTIVINNSEIITNPLNLQAYLSNASSPSLTAIYKDYPKKGGVSEFNSKVEGQEDSGNIAYPLTINSDLLKTWRDNANEKSVIKDNGDGTENELYYIEVSADGQKANLSIEIDNVPTCLLDGTNCNAECSEVASCSDIKDSSNCDNNICTTVGTTGNPSYCSWDNSTGVCNRVENTLNSGTCVFTEETTTGTCNTTGQLTYSWTANWTWSPNSEVTAIQALNADGTLKKDYIKLKNENNYRYDPDRRYEGCQRGRKVLLCPAKAQLSFFNLKNILAAIILIVLIYFVLSFGKKKNKAEKKVTKAVKKVSKPKKKINKKISKKK